MRFCGGREKTFYQNTAVYCLLFRLARLPKRFVLYQILKNIFFFSACGKRNELNNENKQNVIAING